MTDPIADLLTRIRNSSALGKESVNIPHSITKEAICHVLKQEGYISSVAVKKTSPQATIVVSLKYQKTTPVISQITRLSKPGRRVYTKAKDIRTVLSGYGISILSTNKGIMTAKEAKKQNLGGELVCKVW